MAGDIVRYQASDGTEVELDPKTVRDMLVSGSGDATDSEVMAFMAVCRARGLNPLAKDAYLVKYGSSPAATIVSKDFYLRVAQSQPTYLRMRAGVVVVRSGGELEYREGALVGGKTERLVGGWAEVYDSRCGKETPFSKAVVSIDEYDSGKALWVTKKATMIRKVAVVQAIREAYPAVTAGTYDSSEMGAIEVPYEIREER